MQNSTTPAIAADPIGPIDEIPGLIGSEDWSATIETVEETKHRYLLVQGTLLFRSAGYRARLEPSSPQGINPLILLLDLVVRHPDEHLAQVITRVPVRYLAPRPDVTSVTILPLGIDIPVGAAEA